MSDQSVKVRISGLEPTDNTDLQKALRNGEIGDRAGLSIDVEPRREGDARHGEPVTIALVLKVVIAVAPPALNLIGIWLDQRKKRAASSSTKPLTIEVVLPSGEKATFSTTPAPDGSHGDAEQLLQFAKDLGKSIPIPRHDA